MHNDLILKALKCSNQGRPPVWIMRQAGRYLPEYRAIRAKYSFLEMCHQPELVVEVTQLPVNLLGVDAAILFSDILVIPEALNVGLHFEDGVGPIIDRPLKTAKDVEALPNVAIREKLQFVSDSIKLLKPSLKVPLLGFCGAPFTVASYMIEGGSSRDFKKTKQWMLRDPKSFHALLQKIADYSIEYLRMQLESGADAVQIFDSWAHALGHMQFREFSLRYLDYIVRALPDAAVILYCRGSSIFASQLAETAPAAISLDWQSDITRMRNIIPKSIALQGNLDPDLLYAEHHVIKTEVKRILKGMKGDPGYIFNLGHGVHPDTPVDAVKTLIECVQEA